eukprot:TRINITY_DN25665_c0_g2_i2.p1 TRINITY_DN25665_c0_g2~~TRINITY_DN25665_c0_g2_i2.p1  ORF type:complete len:325 (+),score=52.41 TRINITY_DN25665_c0_g2_i2:58-975(+)
MGQQSSCVLASCKCTYPNPHCHCELDLSRCEQTEFKNFVDQQPLDFSSVCEIGQMPRPMVPRCPAEDEEVSPLQGNTSATRKLSAEAEVGVNTLDQWLSSEIGDEKLTRTADELLIKALRKAPDKDLRYLQLTKQTHSEKPKVLALHSTDVPQPSTGRSTQEPCSPSEVSPASAEQGHQYPALWDNEDQSAPLQSPDVEQVERAKRNVRFQEGVESRELSQDQDAEVPAARREDILWHLLPEPGPPAASQKPRRVPKGRRRSDDTGSDCSDGSASSRGSRGSRSSLGSRGSRNSALKVSFAPRQV